MGNIKNDVKAPVNYGYGGKGYEPEWVPEQQFAKFESLIGKQTKTPLECKAK